MSRYPALILLNRLSSKHYPFVLCLFDGHAKVVEYKLLWFILVPARGAFARSGRKPILLSTVIILDD